MEKEKKNSQQFTYAPFWYVFLNCSDFHTPCCTCHICIYLCFLLFPFAFFLTLCMSFFDGLPNSSCVQTPYHSNHICYVPHDSSDVAWNVLQWQKCGCTVYHLLSCLCTRTLWVSVLVPLYNGQRLYNDCSWNLMKIISYIDCRRKELSLDDYPWSVASVVFDGEC